MTNTNVTTTVLGSRATLQYGPWIEHEDVVGKSVRELKQQFDSWTIPADAKAMKGKVEVGDDYILQPGDKIELFRQMGEKGLGRTGQTG